MPRTKSISNSRPRGLSAAEKKADEIRAFMAAGRAISNPGLHARITGREPRGLFVVRELHELAARLKKREETARAAYARMDTATAQHGLGRPPAETFAFRERLPDKAIPADQYPTMHGLRMQRVREKTELTQAKQGLKRVRKQR